MKKIITLITFLSYLLTNAQCPAPSNLILSIPYPTAAELSWTENGSAISWEIAIIPDFIVGTPLPSEPLYVVANNQFLILALPPAYGCYAFFVRSVCSPTLSSPWTAVGSLGCSTNVYNWLGTLANNDFVVNQDKSNFQIAPNPAKNSTTISFNNTATAPLLEVYDLLGKSIISYQTSNNNDNWFLDTSKLAKGLYVIALKEEEIGRAHV